MRKPQFSEQLSERFPELLRTRTKDFHLPLHSRSVFSRIGAIPARQRNIPKAPGCPSKILGISRRKFCLAQALGEEMSSPTPSPWRGRAIWLESLESSKTDALIIFIRRYLRCSDFTTQIADERLLTPDLTLFSAISVH